MVLFIEYVVLTFESVDGMLWCDLSHGATVFVFQYFTERNWKMFTFDFGHFWEKKSATTNVKMEYIRQKS